MRLTIAKGGGGCRSGALSRGFTLVEVLAALLFMAIVIPVVMQGLSVASRAGELAGRRYQAGLVAERVLNEAIILTNWSQSTQVGRSRQGALEFEWTLRNEPWLEDRNVSSMRLVSVDVSFLAQGQKQIFTLSTLVDENTTTSQTNLLDTTSTL
jgi:prepilin-type N-terminal cleavage/methylation domain-containing protein